MQESKYLIDKNNLIIYSLGITKQTQVIHYNKFLFPTIAEEQKHSGGFLSSSFISNNLFSSFIAPSLLPSLLSFNSSFLLLLNSSFLLSFFIALLPL